VPIPGKGKTRLWGNRPEEASGKGKNELEPGACARRQNGILEPGKGKTIEKKV